ncbi:MAG: hypothetical protein ACE5HP_09845 [Gemmatimonadota bacterium]
MGDRLRGPGTTLPALFLIVATLGACKSDPTGPILQVEGTYTGDWTFEAFDETGALTSTNTCPGSITLSEQEGRSFGGTFLVTAAGDCEGLSPISGELVNGEVRADGGLEFTLTVLPFVGPGAAGCTLVGGTNGMNGAVTGAALSVFTTARLVCPAGDGQVQIRMEGTR